MINEKTIVLPIRGMHCASCELLVEKNLKKISGVERAEVNHTAGVAKIYYQNLRPDHNQLDEAVRSAGYQIGESGQPAWLSEKAKDYKYFGLALLLALAGWWTIDWLGLTNIGLGAASNPKGQSIALLVGLVAGFSTCMALVGGLTLGLAAKYAEHRPEASAGAKFRPHLFFNLGRIVGFAFLGGLLGSLGSVFQLSSLTMAALTLLVAVVMLLLGLQLTEISPRLSNWKFTLPKNLAHRLGINRDRKDYSHRSAIILGASSFFLPCGFTQAMQLFAVSTGSFYLGALTMGLFALGTAPGLLLIGGVTSVIKNKKDRFFFRFAGVVVIFLALFNASNAIALTKINLNIGGTAVDNVKTSITDPNVTIQDGVQIVRMVENYNGYSPNKITIAAGLPVRWIIDAQAPYSCASALVVPKLKINKSLKAGENIIEFPAQSAGRIPFSCSMGMYTGVFIVTDKSGGLPEANAAEFSDTAPLSGGTCNHGGSGGCGCGVANRLVN